MEKPTPDSDDVFTCEVNWLPVRYCIILSVYDRANEVWRIIISLHCAN